MSTQEFPPDEQATDTDAGQQPPDEQPADADDEVETAVDAIIAEDEDDAPAEIPADSGQ